VTTLLLARHGETDWNREGRWQGQTNTSLNDRGRGQALALAEQLRAEKIAAVYSSDLERAVETAAIVAAERDLPVRQDRRLRELFFGEWEGLTTPEIETRFPEEVTRWRANGAAPGAGGETYPEMGKRVVAALEEIAAAHPDEIVLVILHGGPIRGLLAHAAGISYEEQREIRAHLANCDVVRIGVQNGKFTPVD
jgi:glucosyl-3-phosphoglycerate phosphatase